MYQLPKINTLIFLGGGSLLLKLCDWCVEENINVKVITSPRHADSKPSDDSAFTDTLKKKSIDTLVTEKINCNEINSFIGKKEDACFISIAAPWLFTHEEINDVFDGRLLNVHGTRLPQGRGGAPISWQVMMGSKLGYCQLHKVTPNIDEGDIILFEEFLYSQGAYKPVHYMAEYEKHNVNFLKKFIGDITTKQMNYETLKQPTYLSTYYPRLNTKENSWINWEEPIENLCRFICAFDDPYTGAQTLLNGTKVRIKTVQIEYSEPSFHSFQAGLIYRKNKDWICVCGVGGSLIISEIFDQGGNNIIEDVKLGDRLHTSSELLDKRLSRHFFRP